ncbi:MAG: HNH endonuclease [Sedimentisphaerales bacterium]
MVGIQIRIPLWLDLIFAWPVLVYRKWKFGYPFRKIPLGEGEYTIVDPDIYYKFRHLKLFLFGDKTNYYAACSIKDQLGRTSIKRLHRLITNAPDGLLVDHRNGDSLDNRIANLRFATRQQNSCNSRKQDNCTSKFRGVSWNKCRNKWRAALQDNKKCVFRKSFDSEIEAAKAYDEAAKLYHREFAHLNFPQGRLDKAGDCGNLGSL